MTSICTKTLHKGQKWSGVVGKGKLIQFTALEAGANVSLLLYNAHDLTERYNMPDTLKAQHTAFLTTGNILMSDNGRAMASVVQDSTGWIDTITGYCTREQVDAQYGKTTYQQLRNDYNRSGDENFTIELVRNGLGVRDLVPPVNLFSKVYCDDEGGMHFVKEHCPKGATITLRTEMDVLVILSNTPNTLDESDVYPAVPVTMEVTQAAPVGLLDPCVTHCGENKRAFENTWEYFALME